MSFPRCFIALIAIQWLVFAGCENSPIADMSRSELSKENPYHDTPQVKTSTVDEALAKLKKLDKEAWKIMTELKQAIRGIRDDRSAEKVIEDLREKTDNRVDDLSTTKQNKIYISYKDKDRWAKEFKDFQKTQKEKAEKEVQEFLIVTRNASTAKLSFDVRSRLGRAMESYGTAITTWSNRQFNSRQLRYHFDADVTAYVAFTGLSNGSKIKNMLMKKVSDVAGAVDVESQVVNGTYWMKVVPVEDFEGLIRSIRVGTQEDMDRDARIVKFTLSQADQDQLIAEAKRAEKERKAAVAKQRKQAEQSKIAEIKDDIQEQQQQYKDIVQELESIQSPQDVEYAADELKSQLRKLQFKNRSRRISSVGIPDDVADTLQREMDEAVTESEQEIDTELSRINSDAALRREFAKLIGSKMDAKRLLKWDGSKPRNQPHEDSRSPDYVSANLELLRDGDTFEARDALKRLASVDPKSVESAVRKQVAVALREKALSGNEFKPGVMVNALTNWGGRYSVPILIDLLKKSGRGSLNKEVYFNALGDFPTKEGADAVAGYVDDFFVGKFAIQSLRKMGSLAEDALIKIAPSNDFDVSRFAVEQLGKVGTSKSLSILKKAKKSSNREISELAKLSIQAIEEREAE